MTLTGLRESSYGLFNSTIDYCPERHKELNSGAERKEEIEGGADIIPSVTALVELASESERSPILQLGRIIALSVRAALDRLLGPPIKGVRRALESVGSQRGPNSIRPK